MAGDQLGIDRPEDRHVAHRVGAGQRDRLEARRRPVSAGVRPPCWNQAWPRMMVEPAAMKLMATPETIWLPRWVIEAKPCTSANSDRDRRSPMASPSQAEPVDRGGRRAGEGAGQHLAFEPDVEDAGALGIEAGEAGEQQRHRQADGRVEELDEGVEELHLRRPLPWRLAVPTERGLNEANSVWIGGPEHVLQRAGEQDDQALDDDDHVAR